MNHTKPHKRMTIQDLYPQLTPAQQEEAAMRLDGYLAVIKRIYERKMMRLTDHKRAATLPFTDTHDHTQET